MSLKIGSDVDRFQKILKGKVRDDLKKIASSEDLIGQQGGKTIKIPIKNIDLPRFVYGSQQKGGGGAGMGDGDPGDPMGGASKPGKGSGKGGNEPGEHEFSVEFAPDELAQMLQEYLQLPNLENKGKGQVNSVVDRYSGIQNLGPEGLRHFKRTYKKALVRSMASGTYDPNNPKIIPVKEDKKFKAPKFKEEQGCNTAVIYMMDVSGSMGDEQKHIAKSEVFWIDLWLKSQYKNIESRFLVHDTSAKEVTQEEFFKIAESGGTSISSAYELCSKIMEEDYPFSDWNVYPIHFSDGDNWDLSDDQKACDILQNLIIPNCNIFSYGQIAGSSGSFIHVLSRHFESELKIALSQIDSPSDILDSIKTFFGGGK